MKKALLMALLLPMTAMSQVYSTLAVDPVQETASLKFNVVAHEHYRIGVGYETKKDFHRYSLEAGRKFYIGTKFEFIPMVEFSMLQDDLAFFTYGVAIENNYPLARKINLSLNVNLTSAQNKDLMAEVEGNRRTHHFVPGIKIGVVYELFDPTNN